MLFKLLQTRWLRTTHIFLFFHNSGGQKSEVSVTRPKPRCQHGCFPLGSSWGRSHFLNYSNLCRGVQPFGVPGPHWKKKSCLRPYINYIETRNHKKKIHTVLSKFRILCWASFIAILGGKWPMQVGHPCLELCFLHSLVQDSFLQFQSQQLSVFKSPCFLITSHFPSLSLCSNLLLPPFFEDHCDCI